MKIEGLIKGQKLTTPNFLDKFLFWEKSPKIPLEQGFFFGFFQKFNPQMFLFFPKNGQQQCSLLFHESGNSGKSLDLQLLPKMLSINQIVRFFDH